MQLDVIWSGKPLQLYSIQSPENLTFRMAEQKVRETLKKEKSPSSTDILNLQERTRGALWLLQYISSSFRYTIKEKQLNI